ncbi:HWE histidine kinase domain-containing protein [Phenylobacterium sp.]|uniref:HWE histidine kinase domain-containing protein n=1 Tax=Phenylobacterium sp. TaxID=1871053 RepID=UPI0025E992DE|nr:HWE histidine kinase domain-containing protein [Phenylobacterium sp.]
MSEKLRAENERLAARVADLEAQLAAKPPIDRISLYRMAQNAPWGVMAINPEGVIDYANPAFQRWLTQPAPAWGLRRQDAVAPQFLAVMQAPFDAALQGVPHESDVSLRDVSGELREMHMHIMPRGTTATGITGAIVSLYDVTETQALDRSVRENEARLGHINAVVPSVIYIYDTEIGCPIWFGGRVVQVLGYTADEIAERPEELRGRLVHPDDLPKVMARIEQLAQRPDGEVGELEFRILRRDGAFRWVLDRAVVFERTPDGRVLKTLSAAIDIDDRRRAEERRTTLINELNHRVKNTLAAVQSIARQTLRHGRPPELTVELFTDRLVALSAAHDVLTRENWEGAGLHEIVDGALKPFEAHGEGRIAVAGPEVRLGSRAALALAMALHELATNAVKYGALSGEAGKVALTWRAHQAAGAARLELEWRESGGPRVAPPTSSGFGSRLLTQGLAADLAGAAELNFAPDGLVCRITAPLEATPLLELA